MDPVLFRTRWWIRAHSGVTAGLALLVALVGGLVLSLAGGAARTLSAPDRYSDARGHEWDLGFEQAHGPPRLAELQSLPSVRRVGMMTFMFGGLMSAEGSEPANALVFVGSPDGTGARLAAGRAADPAHPGEFVANQSLVDDASLQLGDTFQLLTFTSAQAQRGGFDSGAPEGPSLPAVLVGVVEKTLEDEDETNIAVFPPSLLDEGDIGVAASVGLISTAPGTTPEQLRAELDSLPDGQVFSLEEAQWVPSSVRRAVNAQGQGLVIVAVIVGIAAVAVLSQVLQRRLRLSPAERSALSATGLTRGQLVADPLSRATISVVLGVVGAAVLAVLTSGVFPLGFAKRVEPNRGLRIDAMTHLVGAVVLGVVLVAWLAVALTVQDRRRRPVRVEGRALPNRPPQLCVGSRFAFARAATEGGSPIGPLLGVVAVLTVCVGAVTFGASLDRVIDEPERYGTTMDIGVGQGGEIPQQAADLLAADADVATLWLYSTLRVSVGAESLDVTGMEAVKGDLSPHVFSGRLPVDPSEIALGRVASRSLGVGVGDELTISGSEGDVTKRVTGIVVVPSIEGGEGIGEGGVLTFDGLRSLDSTVAPSSAGLDLRPGAPADTTNRLSEELGILIGGPFGRPAAVISLTRVRSLPVAVAVVLLALAALSLLHQLVLSVQRRRRDVGVLRAVGADSGWVRSVRLWQASLLSLVAVVVSVPLGVIVGGTVFRAFIDRIGAQDDIAVPYVGILVIGLSLLVLANLTMIVAATRADRHRRTAAALADE